MGRAPTAAKVIRKKNDREIPQKKRPPPAGYLGWWSVNLKAGRGISPLQGLVIILRNIPRAMPWAFTWRPVGAWVIALRVNLENVPSVWRTSRPKGRGHATNHAFLVPTGRGHATNHAFLVPTGRGHATNHALPAPTGRCHATNHAFLVPTGRGRATNHALPAPTGRPVKAQGIALVLTHILTKSGEVRNF